MTNKENNLLLITGSLLEEKTSINRAFDISISPLSDIQLTQNPPEKL